MEASGRQEKHQLAEADVAIDILEETPGELSTNQRPSGAQGQREEPSSSEGSIKNGIEKPFRSIDAAIDELRELRLASASRLKSVKFGEGDHGGSSGSRFGISQFRFGEHHTDMAPRNILKRESQRQTEREGPRKSQVYDPYFGIGALPAEPLPPLALALRFIDSQRFERRTKAQELWLRVAIYTASLGTAACFFVCLILFVHQVTNQPRPPVVMMEFSVSFIHQIYPVSDEVILQQQQEGKGNYYAFYLNWCYFGVLNMTNPNKHLDFHFDYLEVTLFYRGFQLGFDRIEDFSSPRGSVLRPFFCLFALSLPIPLDVGTMLNAEIAQNDFMVVSELIFKGSVSILPGLKSMRFWTRYQCHVHRQDIVGENSCRLLSTNWLPKNDHFRLYRKDYWTRFVNLAIGYSFYLPEDYFDYNSNLYLPYKKKFNITSLGA